jgi:hypothetical protein
MKTLLALSALLFSQSVFASGFEETCLNRYRDATLSLVDSARAFNDGSSSAGRFLGELALIETEVGATRVLCSFEPTEIKNCVRMYKRQYQKLRVNVDAVEITRGNQKQVKIGLVEAGLAIVDLQCQ